MLTQETKDAIKTAEKSCNGWEFPGNGILGGPIYKNLTETYGSHGIQVEMMGGRITVTPESPAYDEIAQLAQ